MQRRWGLITAIITVVSLAACGGTDGATATETTSDGATATETTSDGATATETTSLRFAVAATAISPTYAPFTSVPQTLDYWKDEGLEVEIIGVPGGSAALQVLETGQADIAYGGLTPFFQFIGSGFEGVAVCEYLTKNINQPTVPSDSEIDSIEDLDGKNVAVASLEATMVPFLNAVLEDAGLGEEAVNYVVLQPGPEALAAYENGVVDAFNYWDEPNARLDGIMPDGLELKRLPIPERFDSLPFGGGYVVRREALSENRDAIVGFLRGVAKGQVFAEAAPEAAASIHFDVYPESQPSGEYDEAVAVAVSNFEARLANAQPHDGQFCKIAEGGPEAQMEFLVETGQVESPVEDLTNHYTNELVEEVNDFDADLVRRQAEEYSVR